MTITNPKNHVDEKAGMNSVHDMSGDWIPPLPKMLFSECLENYLSSRDNLIQAAKHNSKTSEVFKRAIAIYEKDEEQLNYLWENRHEI